ncbi:MAG: M3 family metallopeptidase [Halioglobus sp.]
MRNPFFTTWDTPFGIPPFDVIEAPHMAEAIARGFTEHSAEIAAICEQSAAPTFANTLEQMERAGSLLDRVGAVFFNLVSSDNSDELQALETAIMPQYAEHDSAIYTNPALFERVKAIRAGNEGLDDCERRLVEDVYTRFVRHGAALDEVSRNRVSELNEQLAGLMTQFGQNVLNDGNEYELVLSDESELAGLPLFVREAALGEGRQRGKEGAYVFTISRSSITPFLQFSQRRDLREAIYRAYTVCGASDNGYNNEAVLKEIATARAQRAQLLGYPSHAAFMLDDRMAGSPEAVKNLLDSIWAPAHTRVREEARDIQAMIDSEGGGFTLAPWDWDYYAEKVREERFGLDEEVVKPYFLLENVVEGAFDVARKLYGLTFHEIVDAPQYNPDTTTYEVRNSDESLVGVFITDFYMRPSKRSGAWMSEFRAQSSLDGEVRPIVVNCCNFPKSDLCLLGMDEVRTLFHEFGHGLHGLLSQVRFESQSGTNVKQDFVELPSQIMEHWSLQPEVMKSYARHVETAEPIPDALIEKIRAADTFNQGFATTEYLAASYLDLAWHQLDPAQSLDVQAFEHAALAEIDLIDAVDPRYKSTYFQHIFTGDEYSAGYYSYIWAEVLDADGFEAFLENGLFDPATANAFRENVLERGGSEDPMVLYRNFRGRNPEVGPLLRNRGLAAAVPTA